MAPELFSSILDAARDAFRHLENADFPTLAILAGAVILVGILLFRR